jgi:hypothetical protein
VLAGNRGNSRQKFPLMLRRMKADPTMGADIPWMAMGNMAKAAHKAYLDLLMPKFLMLALLSGLAECTHLKGRDIAVMVGENMVPNWAFPIRGRASEELEKANYVQPGQAPGRLLAVCVPPGDISSSAPQEVAQESHKKGTLKHMNLLVAVDGLTPQETMKELLDKTKPLLCKDIKAEMANQLLLHNQGLELLSIRLTMMPTSLADINEGINSTPKPSGEEELTTLLSQQACILAPYIRAKQNALRVVDGLMSVRYIEEASILEEVVNCPSHSLAAYWVIQAATVSDQGPLHKRARKGDRKGKWEGKGKSEGKSSGKGYVGWKGAGKGQGEGKSKGTAKGSWQRPHKAWWGETQLPYPPQSWQWGNQAAWDETQQAPSPSPAQQWRPTGRTTQQAGKSTYESSTPLSTQEYWHEGSQTAAASGAQNFVRAHSNE